LSSDRKEAREALDHERPNRIPGDRLKAMEQLESGALGGESAKEVATACAA
jgi:hypothetical protein